ncbi:MAG TPA: NAD(P)-dependent oxidoreductase, partial [Candidatus Dormibacteraeota bacterium]|nr:NAD(P)-dependent oxidoreductase [Candidatus Dormibacteraeota bacterium]
MRVAVSGSGGRLGRALVGALGAAPFTGPFGPLAWSRPAFDLDAPERFEALLVSDRPEAVVHAAAWTDVDGCARDPDLAMRRNAVATGVLAGACARRGIDLIVVSTNEVFDGDRTDWRGYAPDDHPSPPNPYGRSKLEAERLAGEAYERAPGAALAIVRTAWLFGRPGGDFPDRLLAAAERARDLGQPLRAVDDEIGTPTRADDVAEAIAELLASGAPTGVHHLVNAGVASRADWATELLRLARLDVAIERVTAATWQRASTPSRPDPQGSGLA